MRATVFTLYTRGTKAPHPNGPFIGEVRMKKRADGTGYTVVKMLGNDPRLPGGMYCDRLEIRAGGLVIYGHEYLAVGFRTNNKAKTDRHKQEWWVLTDAPAIAQVMVAQWQSYQRRESSITGFDDEPREFDPRRVVPPLEPDPTGEDG